MKIQVSDTGCGIAEADIPKLFEMFIQAQRNTNTMFGGTGLGLWICKQLCQKMDGDITLYSQVEKGTQFVFYIPINNDRINQERTGAFNLKRDKVKVLVVDDHAFNRHLHKLLLEREGVEVTLASNGKEALEKYREKGGNEYFDFILLDIFMPVMDGFTAALKIREEEKNKERKIDIYFISGEYYSKDEIMAGFRKSGGGNDPSGIRCLRKPIDIEVIRKVVQKYITTR